MLRALTLFACLMLPILANAATGTWGGVMVDTHLDTPKPNLRLWGDFATRAGAGRRLTLGRVAAGSQIAPWVGILAGWATVIVDEPGLDHTVVEHRLWSQLDLWGKPHPALRVQLRSRLENRLMVGPGVGHRLREMVRVDWAPAAIQPVSFVVWDELFIGLAGASQIKGFDQNRLFVGARSRLAAAAHAEAGYLRLSQRTPQRRIEDNILSVFLVFNPQIARRAHGDTGLPEEAEGAHTCDHSLGCGHAAAGGLD